MFVVIFKVVCGVFLCVCLQVQLYFMILERLGKCVEALDVIRGPLGGTNASVLRDHQHVVSPSCSTRVNTILIFDCVCVCVPTEKLTSELQSRENKCMMLYQRLQRWPESNALAHKLLLKK